MAKLAQRIAGVSRNIEKERKIVGKKKAIEKSRGLKIKGNSDGVFVDVKDVRDAANQIVESIVNELDSHSIPQWQSELRLERTVVKETRVPAQMLLSFSGATTKEKLIQLINELPLSYIPDGDVTIKEFDLKVTYLK